MADEKPKENTIRPDRGVIPVGGDKFISTANLFQGQIKKLTTEIKENFDDFIDDFKTVMANVEETIPLDELTEDDKKRGAKTRSREVIGVEIVKISQDVLRKLNFGRGGPEVEDRRDNDTSTSGTFEKIIKMAIPLIGLGAAFIGSITSMLQGGSLQGISNIMSKVFVNLFDKMAVGIVNIFKQGKFFQKMLMNIFGSGVTKSVLKGGGKLSASAFGKILGKGFIKRIPIIGSLISWGSAVTRFRNGQIVQGGIDLLAGVATLFPGVGTAVAIGLDLLNAGIDINNAKNPESQGLTGLMSTLSDWFVDNMFDLPIISSFAHLGKGIGSLLTGDVRGYYDSLVNAGLKLPFMGTLADFLFSSKGADGKNIKGTGASNIKKAVGNMVDFIIDSVTNMFKFAALGARDTLANMGIPKTMLNKGLKLLGLDRYIDEGVEKGEVYGKISRIKELQEKRENASTFKPRGGRVASEQEKIDRQIRSLESDLYGSHDLSIIRSTMRGLHNKDKIQMEQQAKRDAMVAAKLDELNTTLKESQNSTNVGVSNSSNSNSYNFSVAPASVWQQKKNSNPFQWNGQLGTAQ